VTNHEIGGKAPVESHEPIVSPGILNVNLKAKNIGDAKWVAKHLMMNLEILAALDRTDFRYQVYKVNALRDKDNIDLYLKTVL
jgi:hypothetical protein